VIYGSILKGFSRKKRMDRVWEAFEEMKAHGLFAYFAWKRASGLSLQETAITANHHMGW